MRERERERESMLDLHETKYGQKKKNLVDGLNPKLKS